MTIRKSNLFLTIVNGYVVDSLELSNINYWWNLGSLLGVCLVIQLATGIFLAMHYSSNLELAFLSVQHIMIDVNYGWLVRYAHSNGAGFFFIFVYMHMARGIYYGSYRKLRVALWTIGVIIFLVMIITAFLGYCLVYGQMSHWGATVITNLVTAVLYLGQAIAEFSKNNINLKVLDLKQYILGKVNIHARKILRTTVDDYYLNLLKNFIAMLVGLIDGDGYILVTNSGRNVIKLNLIINLHIRELLMLEFFKSQLKFGHIIRYTSGGKEYVKYVINKTDLQDIFLLLLEYHNIYFLTETRCKQYNKAAYILKNNLTNINQILEDKDILNAILFFDNKEITLLDIKTIDFLNNWLIGFIIADGGFFLKNNKSKDACFEITQKENDILLEGIKLFFDTKVKMYKEKGLYNHFVVTSKKDIQTIINFISFSGNHLLLGYKLISYNKWIESLKSHLRYKNLKLLY